MKKVLIISLKKFGDVASTAHLVSSIKKESPSSEVTLLTFTESAKITSALSCIDHLVIINRARVLSLKSAPIFSDAYALNEFIRPIEELKSTHWDLIINHSNDSVSTYLASYLDAEKHSGIIFGADKIARHSSFWSKVFNEVITSQKQSSFNFTEVYHRDNKLTQNQQSNSLYSTAQNEEVVSHKFNELNDGGNKRIVGIQLKSSSINKDIPTKIIEDYTRFCLGSDDLIPVFLISPDIVEKKYASQLCENIGSEITSIETDFRALPSVIKALDLLITPDTSVKHIADLARVPMIEFCAGEAPLFKQSSITHGNIIINPRGGRAEKVEVNDFIKASLGLLKIGVTHDDYSEGVSVYQVTNENNRIDYHNIGLILNEREEIERQINKSIIYLLGGLESEAFNIDITHSVSKEALKNFVQDRKIDLLEMLKSILSTLRSLSQASHGQKQLDIFLQSFENLLSYANQDNIVGIIAKLFRANIETIQSSTLEQNLKTMEAELFQLKSNIEMTTNFLNTLVEQGVEQRVQSRLDL